MTTVKVKDGKIKIKCPAFDMRAKQAPDRKYDTREKVWVMPLVESAAKYVLDNYSEHEYASTQDRKDLEKLRRKKIKQDSGSFPAWYKFKNEPMSHQKEALNRAWRKDAYAFFMEMGTGKTFVVINLVAAKVMDGKAEALLAVCPSSVKPVWKHEVEEHCPIESDVFIIEAGCKKEFERWLAKDRDKMPVLVVGVEALSQGSAYGMCIDFVLKYKTAMAVDESSRIKTHNANRTKKCVELGNAATVKYIMSGTPVTQGMQDLYSQFRFLDWRIIGQRSYFAFQNRYCVMGGFEGRKIVGYTNIDELMEKIAPNAYIVKKEDVLDLPPKVYETITVQPNADQKRILKDIGDDYFMCSDLDGNTLEVETVLERMTRYQQIVGGLFPFDVEGGGHDVVRIPGKNPKMEAMVETINDMPDTEKVIIWARFREEQKMIIEHLSSVYGDDSVVWYTAGLDTDQKGDLIKEFQHGKARFFVSNPTMGGIGLTLTAASYVIYYSNSFSLEDRLQSEDRAHRKGQTKSVTYIDIMMDHIIDKQIVTALKNKKSVADFVEQSIVRNQR
jgi:SNF2 family DNA or RNA helicase